MDKTARPAPRGSISPAGAGRIYSSTGARRIYSPAGAGRFYKPDRGRKARFSEVHKSHPLTAMCKKRLHRSYFALAQSNTSLARRYRVMDEPSRYTSFGVQDLFAWNY